MDVERDVLNLERRIQYIEKTLAVDKYLAILKKWKGEWVVNKGLAETKGYLVRVIE
jgi:hypothetical protein